MARQTTVTVQLEGLPAVVASGECYPPEPEVGISWWVVDGLDWRAAEGELTPEQEVACAERSADLEDAVLAAFHARRDAERSAMAGGAL